MTSARAERMLTMKRWQHLLNKAWEEGIWLVPHPTNVNLALCLSQTRLRATDSEVVFYTVSVYGCSCPARGDCKHRALFLFENPALIPLAVLSADSEFAPSSDDAPVKEDAMSET